MSGINTWINADIDVYKEYIGLIESFHDPKYEPVLNVSIIIDMMGTIGNFDRNKYCCCLYTRTSDQVDCKLNAIYKPLARLLLRFIRGSKKAPQTSIFLIVDQIKNTECHCLCMAMLAVITELIDKEVYKTMKKHEVLDTICDSAMRSMPEIKLGCVKLARRLLEVTGGFDLDSPEFSEINAGIAFIFSSFKPPFGQGVKNSAFLLEDAKKPLPAPRGDRESVMCAESKVDVGTMDVKSVYDYLFGWIIDSYNKSVSNCLIPLQWMTILCSKARKKDLAINFVRNLIQLSKLSMKALFKLKGIVNLLLNTELEIDSMPQYNEVLAFHKRLLVEASKSRGEIEAALRRHKYYLMKVADGEEFRFVKNIATLWRHVLEGVSFNCLPSIIDFTFSMSFRIPNPGNTIGDNDICYAPEQCLLKLSFFYNYEMLSNFLKLVRQSCDSLLKEVNFETPFSKTSSACKESLKNHFKQLCSLGDSKGELMPLACIVFILAESIFHELDCGEFLEAVCPVMEYCLALAEYARARKCKAHETELRKLFELLFTLVLSKSRKQQAPSLVTSVLPLVKIIIINASTPNTVSASLYSELLSGKEGPIFSTDVGLFKSMSESAIVEKLTSKFEKYEFDDKYIAATSDKILDTFKFCKGTSQHSAKQESALHKRFTGAHEELMKEQRKKAEERLVWFELERRKCAHMWKKVQKTAKQWKGPWRDKVLFDTPEGIASLPYRVSSHNFANMARCVRTLWCHYCKYLTNEKYQDCLATFQKKREFYALLNGISSIEFPRNDLPIQAISRAKLQALTEEYTSYLGKFLALDCDSGYKEACATAYECEIFMFLLAKPGKVTLTVEKGRGLIVFAYSEIWQRQDKPSDKRLMFTYTHPRSKKLVKKWPIQRITRAYRKYVIEEKTGLEFFFSDGKSVLFNFANEEDSNQFCAKLAKVYKKLLKTPLCFLDGKASMKEIKLTEDWRSHAISNFDYLLALNSLASRSFDNPSQYPVFPWIISSFSKTFDLNSREGYRDLKLPMGMLGRPSRAREFKEKINQVLIPWLGAFNYGSHYSNPGIVFQFLMRVNPFFEGYIQLFAGLDDPNRMMHSILETFTTACTDSGDIRELIPEFFCLPEIFENSFETPFGVREDDQQPVDNVLLPQWAREPHAFVARSREALEGEPVSCDVNAWVNLVFGYQQRGEDAVKAFNVFPMLTTEPGKSLLEVEEEEKENVKFQAFHWGQTPQQLFEEDHSKKNPAEREIKCLCDRNAKLIIEWKKSSTKHAHEDKSTKLKDDTKVKGKTEKKPGRKRGMSITESSGELGLLDKDGNEQLLALKTVEGTSALNFTAVTSSGTVANGVVVYLMQEEGERDSISKLEYHESMHLSEHCISRGQYKMLGVDGNPPMQVIWRRNSEQLAQGGYLDGAIRTSSFHSTATIAAFTAPVTALKADRAEQTVVAGSRAGECATFHVEGLNWTRKKSWRAHQGAVVWIEISGEMQMMATASVDGSVNVYTSAVSPKLLRVLYHPSKLPVHYVFSRIMT